MRKFTLLLVCFFSLGSLIQAQNFQTSDIGELLDRLKDNQAGSISGLFNPEEQQILQSYFGSQQTVQLPAAYYNFTEVAQGERVAGAEPVTTVNVNAPVPNTGTIYYPGTESTMALVYDSGPHFNIAGSPNLSRLEDTSLGMSTYGFGAANINGFRVADDMVLAAETDITSIDVYAYQTGSTSPSITAVYLQVWDGDPSAGGTVIWGDVTTNLMSNVELAGALRELESAPGDTSRPLQRVTATTTGLSLPAGTYWIDYTLEGSGASGPWAPAVAILGNATTGNGLQFDGTTWVPLIDVGPQGMPFQVYGDLVGGGGACDASNPSNGFEDGHSNTAPLLRVAANDIIVNADENMTLEEITFNQFVLPPSTIASVDVYFYEDAAGFPGALVGSEMGLVPTSATVVGSNFGYDIYETVLDITDFDLDGQAGVPTTYWVGIAVTTTAADNCFWEVTSASMIGNPSAYNDGSGVWQNLDPTLDGVYTFSGTCSPFLGINDNALSGFSYYPNPTSDILNLKSVNTIETVSIFNILGQKVMDVNVGATASEINVSALNTGTYIMKVTVDGQTGTYKMLKN